MDKHLPNIEDLFKKALGENAETPPDEVWNGIDHLLEKEQMAAFKKKYHLLKKMIFLLLFLLLGLSVYIWRDQMNHYAKMDKDTYRQTAKKDQASEASGHLSPAYSRGRAGRPGHVQANSFRSNPKELSDSSLSEQDVMSVKKPGIQNTAGSYRSKKTEPFGNADGVSSSRRQIESYNTIPATAASAILFTRSLIPDNINTHLHDILNVSPLRALVPSVSLKSGKKSMLKGMKKAGDESHFFITVFYSPDIPFYHLRDNDRSNSNTNSRDLEKSESGTFSYTSGILIDAQLNQKWSLQSGLTLSITNMHKEPGIIYARYDNTGKVKYQVNTSSGKGYILPSFSNYPNVGDSIYSRSTTHTLKYLAIPLAVKYTLFGKGKLLIHAMAGLSANVLTGGKITTEVKKGTDNEIEKTRQIHGLKPIYFSTLTGIGFDYRFHKNISVDFSPTLKLALNPINNEISFRSFPNSLGFSTGLKMTLK